VQARPASFCKGGEAKAKEREKNRGWCTPRITKPSALKKKSFVPVLWGENRKGETGGKKDDPNWSARFLGDGRRKKKSLLGKGMKRRSTPHRTMERGANKKKKGFQQSAGQRSTMRRRGKKGLSPPQRLTLSHKVREEGGHKGTWGENSCTVFRTCAATGGEKRRQRGRGNIAPEVSKKKTQNRENRKKKAMVGKMARRLEGWRLSHKGGKSKKGKR